MPRNMTTPAFKVRPADTCVVASVRDGNTEVHARPADLSVVAPVLEEKTGIKAPPADFQVGVLTRMQRLLDRACGESYRAAPFQAGASCASHSSWCSLTPNKRIQPTPVSSLRSSTVAADPCR